VTQAEEGVLGSERRRTLVVDSGTGTTAVGIALGVAALGLPWHVVGVMLAGENDDYVGYQRALLAAVRDSPPASAEAVRAATVAQQLQLPLSWVPRVTPRRFGKVLPGELRACRDVARATGVLLDPIYTLAGWQVRL
jgi:D-cysteine desulfhydrase